MCCNAYVVLLSKQTAAITDIILSTTNNDDISLLMIGIQYKLFYIPNPTNKHKRDQIANTNTISSKQSKFVDSPNGFIICLDQLQALLSAN